MTDILDISLEELLNDNYKIEHNKPDEIYKRVIIDGIETSYLISNYGNMKHINGYIVTYQYIRGIYPIKIIRYRDANNISKVKPYRINILVAEYFCPKRKSIIDNTNLQVHHINFDPKDNHFWNLVWVTFDEHYKLHDDVTGHENFHKSNPSLKYTDDQIKNVCELLSNNVPVSKIENITHVSSDMIYALKTKKFRKDIVDNYDIKILHKHLDDNDVHRICKLIEAGYTNTEISKLCNINPKKVSEIRSGRSYYRISKLYNINYTSDLYINKER